MCVAVVFSHVHLCKFTKTRLGWKNLRSSPPNRHCDEFQERKTIYLVRRFVSLKDKTAQ